MTTRDLTMTKTANLLALLALLAAPACAIAQDNGPATAPKPPDHYYKLNLAVEELSSAGQVTNTRSYTAIITETTRASQEIRTGSRLPIATSVEASGSTQFQYVDVGVKFDVRDVKEIGDKLAFVLVTEVSSVGPEQKTPSGTPLPAPVIRTNNWNTSVLIPIGKPTVAFSSDNLEDKGRMQVELTATRIE